MGSQEATSLKTQANKGPQERCRSERLKKEIRLTTQAKNENMAKKRCMEGNTSHPSSLADIDNNSMCVLAKNMGVVIENDEFDTFDIVKKLELARANLYDKQHNSKNLVPTTDLTKNDEFGDTLLIEWHRDESSESDDFIKSLSVKKKTGTSKKVKFALRGKKQDQEDLGL